MTSSRVYVSTGGATSARSSVDLARVVVDESEFGVELSGGAFVEGVDEAVASLASGRAVLLHNYFPPPVSPFVLNLAESDQATAVSSIDFVRRALDLSACAGARYFAVHAGFLVSPDVSELGRKIGRRPKIDRALGLGLMNERLVRLADHADQVGVKLLVENHVLSRSNWESFGENFLLLVDPEEIIEWHREMADHVGFLLDVGHLNVSANTLGFDHSDSLRALSQIAEGYHLSSNDGLADAHGPLTSDDWFWSGISRDKAFYTVEIHGHSVLEWIDSAEITAEWLNSESGRKGSS